VSHPITFQYLSERMDLVHELAQSHVEAFGTLLRDWTVASAEEELREHAGRCCIPTTLLAMDGDTWLGSVSLLQNDDERIRQYSPWLASLVVREQARGRGIGRALVARCIVEAKALHVPALYLYCEADLVAYYGALGWREQDMVMLGKLPVAVMAHDVATPRANNAA
jgi:predicted N-acetyltransferase YhbS